MADKFLSCDWGTSSFRLRLVDTVSLQIISESYSDEGIAATFAAWQKTGSSENERIYFYQSVIDRHIKKIEQQAGSRVNYIPIIISGMASSSIGMLEIPYASLPFLLNGEGLQYKKIDKTALFQYDMVIISGVSTGNDVMRGEETQLIGCANTAIMLNEIFIFTGTHSKHIKTDTNKATAIKSFMTGEFFELLGKKSVLSDSVAAGGSIDEPESKTAFEQGVQDSQQGNILHYGFMVRTNQLFKRFSKKANYFYLSGLLVGTELGYLTGTKIDTITIAGDEELVHNYTLALKALGIKAKIQTADTAAVTIKGQLRIYEKVYNNQQ